VAAELLELLELLLESARAVVSAAAVVLSVVRACPVIA
jgi:hypothetical protein